MATVAAVAMIAVGGVGCSSARGAGPAPSISAPTSVTPRVVVPRAVAPTPLPTPAVEAPHMSKSTPVRVRIPAIGVDSKLMALGLKADGTMEVPPTGFPAGWYTGAPTPGEMGPAIIAGHVDWNGPGVFYKLHNLKLDDEVSVTREDGSVAAFRVTRVEQFAKVAFPTGLVYGDIAYAGLRLITCGGLWNPKIGHYDDNVVVFATFIAPAG
jgi:hypothetical protein